MNLDDCCERRNRLQLERAFLRGGMGRRAVAGLRRGGRGSAPSGGGTPTPPVSADLHTWLRADQLTSGSPVQTWTCLNSGRTFSQATSGARPSITTATELNSQTVLRFDGTDDHLISDDASSTWAFLHTGPAHVFGVWVSRISKPSALGARYPVLCTSVTYSDDGIIFGEVPNTERARFELPTRATADIASSLLQDTGRWVHALNVDGRATYEAEIDVSGGFTAAGVAPFTQSAAASPPSTLYIGARSGPSNAYQHDLAEILIYSAEKSGAELTSILSYLNTRYGLST
jgi:hypothetical protein